MPNSLGQAMEQVQAVQHYLVDTGIPQMRDAFSPYQAAFSSLNERVSERISTSISNHPTEAYVAGGVVIAAVGIGLYTLHSRRSAALADKEGASATPADQQLKAPSSPQQYNKADQEHAAARAGGGAAHIRAVQVDDSQYMPAGSACTHDESDETLYAAEHEFGSFPHEDGYGVSSHLGYDSEDYEAYMALFGAQQQQQQQQALAPQQDTEELLQGFEELLQGFEKLLVDTQGKLQEAHVLEGHEEYEHDLQLMSYPIAFEEEGQHYQPGLAFEAIDPLAAAMKAGARWPGN